MQIIMKRSLALLLAIVLCFSAIPISAFATEVTPDDTASSEAPLSETPGSDSQPNPTVAPENTSTPENPPAPSTEPSPELSATPEPTGQPEAIL